MGEIFKNTKRDTTFFERELVPIFYILHYHPKWRMNWRVKAFFKWHDRNLQDYVGDIMTFEKEVPWLIEIEVYLFRRMLELTQWI